MTDNHELALAIAEASRALADQGFIAVYDFDSFEQTATPYEHLEPLLSYRGPYAAFLENSGFVLVAKIPLSHSNAGKTATYDVTPRVRTALWIFTRNEGSS